MIAAGGEINFFVLVVMAVIGIINWLANRKNDEPPKSAPPPRTPPTSRRAPADGEDERMRRFLEALGVPADAPQQRPAPPVAAPPPVQKRPKQPKQPKRRPPPLPVEREVSLDELPAPSLPAAQIELAELSVPSVADYQSVSGRISATPRHAAETAAPATARASVSDLIRRDLASPAQLRGAFVLREILGPPKALQS